MEGGGSGHKSHEWGGALRRKGNVPSWALVRRMRIPLPTKGRRTVTVAVGAIVLAAALWAGTGMPGLGRDVEELDISDVMGLASVRASDHDHVLVAADAPLLASVATSAACWYDRSGGGMGLVPLLLDGDADEAAQQARLVAALGLAKPLRVDGPNHTLTSVRVAVTVWQRAAGAVVVQKGEGGYNASLVGGVIASYLNVPLLVWEGGGSTKVVAGCLADLGASYVLLAGPFEPSWRELARDLGLPVVRLDGRDLHAAQLALAADGFGRVDYGVLANPSDATGISCVDVQAGGAVEWEERGSFAAVSRVGHVETLSSSDSSATVGVPMEPGIQRLQLRARLSNMDDPLEAVKQQLGVVPILSLSLEDADGGLVAYGSSIGYRAGEAALDVVAVDVGGDLSLRVSAYYGIKGRTNTGTMGQGWDGVGWSRVSADWEVRFERIPVTTPLVPQLPGLSRLSSYLAAAHGGFVVADPGMSYLDEGWAATTGAGKATGPWYDESLHAAANARVERNVGALRSALGALDMVPASGGGTLLDAYLGGPAWLAILGDAASIPQWYEPKETSWEEDVQYGLGWASDEPYRLDGNLSIGRPLSSTVAGTSTLIARTLFYEPLAQAYESTLAFPEDNDWSNNYMLLYGEGGGQTGGLFWQRPFADELRAAGFDPHQYGDNLQNDRQTMQARGAYERSNYMEVMLHGNWYWYCPEMNGLDEYSTSVKVLDVRDWSLGPSVLLSAACLMGRIDGVPADQSIALAFMHAGANAFVGATRSTGSESGTRWMEWDLIHNDTSVGEALRRSMADHPEPPTVWVRMLFADPAFNPYEPGNGFADQGRPELLP